MEDGKLYSAALERASMYIRQLAEGINPFTHEDLPDDTILNDVRLARCFFFVSDALERVLAGEFGGDSTAHKRCKFFLTPEQKHAVQISQTPIYITVFTERLNAVIDTARVKKISPTRITGWLMAQGFLENRTDASGKNARLPTPKGISLGLSEIQAVSESRIEYRRVKYNTDAQSFILENIERVMAGN